MKRNVKQKENKNKNKNNMYEQNEITTNETKT